MLWRRLGSPLAFGVEQLHPGTAGIDALEVADDVPVLDDEGRAVLLPGHRGRERLRLSLTQDTLTLKRDGAEAEGPFGLDAFHPHAGVREVASLLTALGDVELAKELDPSAPWMYRRPHA